jgi:hypothetical protein
MNYLKSRIAQSPRMAHSIGEALFFLGGFLIVSGLMGRTAMLAINTVRPKANLPALQRLGEAYPDYPLWFVPESALGYVVGAALAGLGVYVALTARAFVKANRPGRRRR